MAIYLYAHVNIFAIVILMLMFFGRSGLGMQSHDQRLYNIVLITNALALVFDMFIIILEERVFPGARLLLNLCIYFYYICNNTIPLAWLIYCDYKIYGSLAMLKKRLVLYFPTYIVSLVLLAVNMFTGLFFSVDAASHYVRGDYSAILSIIAAIPALIAEYLTAKKAYKSNNMAEKREYRYLSLFLLLPLLSMVIQILWYGVQLLWTSSVISLTLIYINVQNRQIYNDELTGISNRRYVMRNFASHIENLRDGNRLFLVMIDLDSFKSINDTYGHTSGDAMLIRAASVLEGVCEAHRDTVARMGGDEFVVFGIRKKGKEIDILNDIERAQNECNKKLCAEIPLSMSCGMAIYGEDDATTLDKIMSVADRRMYAVKAAKKKRLKQLSCK